MADTSLLEVARQTHEEAERYQQALVDILVSSASSSAITHKNKLKRAHHASDLLDRITSRYSYLDDFYADTTGERTTELESLSSQHKDDALLGEFYARLKRIKQYHEKYPGAVPDAFSVDFGALESSSSGPSSSAATQHLDAAGLDFIDRMFSGEEMAGRFLDLYVLHEAYLNLKGGVSRNTYLDYIDSFDHLVGPSAKITQETKKSEAYRTYLQSLRQYLSTFLRKTQPLANIDDIETTALDKFEAEWEAGKVEGWPERGERMWRQHSSSSSQPTAPQGEGIWCEACRRSYSKQTVYDAHLKSPKHLKAAERLAASGSEAQPSAQVSEKGQVESARRQARAKAIAREEVLVMALGRSLESIRADTKSNVERKAALTDRERQAEAEAADEELNRMSALNPSSGLDGDGAADGTTEQDDDDATSKVYNPLKLPLGWDGRPIPYWLYKLHGLGQDFQCEICSDFVYQGRKNFEKHFQESRHAFGMRALGLPNTVQFRDVTKIADALALAEKLRRQGRLTNENQNDAEEVEDEHGNTYSKKTYELLKRQGLL